MKSIVTEFTDICFMESLEPTPFGQRIKGIQKYKHTEKIQQSNRKISVEAIMDKIYSYL